MIHRYIIEATDEVKGFKEAIERLDREWGIEELEPCEDSISRQAVLDILKREGHKWGNDYRDWVDAIEEIKNLSSVNPTKTGHWEQYGNSWEDKFKCSECGKEQPKIICCERIIGHWSDYCPNCGARMVEPQESEKRNDG